MRVKQIVAAFVALVVVGVFALVMLKGVDQTITKKYGGSTSIELKQGERLEMLTWKDDQIWTQTRMREPGEQPITHKFREHSKYGMLEGEVVVKEK